MDWYYAVDGEQRGPISASIFDSLVASGTIFPETLVWREGMESWVPYSSIADSASDALPETGDANPDRACMRCGREFPASEVVVFGENAVCSECKPYYVQQIHEGGIEPGVAMQHAGFWIRFAAVFVDGLILGMVNMTFGVLIGLISAAGDGAESAAFITQIILNLISVILQAVYEILMVGKYGATLGKMVCKLRIVTHEGQPISYGRSTGRHFAKYISYFTLYIGFMMAGWDREKRGLHDRICSTRVVRV